MPQLVGSSVPMLARAMRGQAGLSESQLSVGTTSLQPESKGLHWKIADLFHVNEMGFRTSPNELRQLPPKGHGWIFCLGANKQR